MIVFKNGEFLGGDLMDIIHINWDDTPDSNTWWNHLLLDGVAVLIIPKNGIMRLFEVGAENLEFIPRQSEDFEEHHSTFWESLETYVLSDIGRAIQFMKFYDGDFEKEVKEFLAEIQQEILHDEVIEKFQCTCNLSEEANSDFMNDLTQFVQNCSLPTKQVLASMKLYMLNIYKTDIESSNKSLRI